MLFVRVLLTYRQIVKDLSCLFMALLKTQDYKSKHNMVLYHTCAVVSYERHEKYCNTQGCMESSMQDVNNDDGDICVGFFCLEKCCIVRYDVISSVVSYEK